MGSKNSASGRRFAAIHKDDGPPGLPEDLYFPTINELEVEHLNDIPNGVFTIDKGAQLWLNLYHSMVWLGVATNLQLCEEVLTARSSGQEIINHHHAPALYEDDDKEGWFFNVPSIEPIPEQVFLDEAILQEAYFWHDFNQPALCHVLDLIKDTDSLARVSSDWRSILDACRTSAQDDFNCNNSSPDFSLEDCEGTRRVTLDCHSRSTEYLQEALGLVQTICSRVDFGAVQSWLTNNTDSMPDDVAARTDWLKQALEINALGDILKQRYDDGSLSEDVKSHIAKKLHIVQKISTKTLSVIYARLAKVGILADDDTLDYFIQDKVMEKASDAHKQAWHDLQTGIYAAIAWFIFHQATIARDEVKSLLGV